MHYDSISGAWAFANAKTAALYFDRVHILDGLWLDSAESLEQLREQLLRRQTDEAKTLVGVGIGVGTGVHIFTENLLKVVEESSKLLLGARNRQEWEWSLDYLTKSCMAPKDKVEWLRLYLHLRLALERGIILGGSEIHPAHASPVTPATEGEPSLFLTQSHLVDAERMSWDQIFELRKDQDSLSKLRRLRLFLYERYQNQPMSFLRDDLLQRIEDYEATARKCRLDLIDSSMAVVCDKEVVVSAAVALVALLEGATPIAVAATVPMFAKLGSVALDLRRTRRNYHFEGLRDPVAFLCEARSVAGAA